MSTEGSYYVHPSSVIDKDVEIGKDTKIWHFCHVSEGARIGENCNVGQNTFVGKGVEIGSGVKIQNNVSVYSGVKIEDDVFLGPSCVFTNVSYPRAYTTQGYTETLVEKGASIGANATIKTGVTVGAYSLVGAGAVVIKDVEPHSIVVGNPARPTGNRIGEDGKVLRR